MSRGKTYNAGLDFLRIFAMFSVVWIHLSIYLPMSDSLRKFFTWGGHGVQFFFVLSGYLALLTYNGKQQTVLKYYKGRAIRILPAYYFALAVAAVFRRFVLKDISTDIFHLSWLRYLFGLNTILPSNNYELWNNAYGFWTLSCFICFYIAAPLIVKIVRSLKKAWIFWAASFGVMFIWKVVITRVFSNVSGLDSLDAVTGASIFGMLYQFAIGIVVYYIVEEKKNSEGIIMMSLLSIVGLIIAREVFTWCALCGILIICFAERPVKLSNIGIQLVKKVSLESYHVYLAHLLSFEMAIYIINLLKININTFIGIAVWGMVSIVLIGLFCISMDCIEKKLTKIVLSS